VNGSVKRLAVANGANIFQMLLVIHSQTFLASRDVESEISSYHKVFISPNLILTDLI